MRYRGGRKTKKQTRGPSLDSIMNDVAGIFNETPELVKSKSKKKEHIIPRRIYCYVACLLTNASLVEISDLLSSCDHSDVCYHRQKVIDFKKVNDFDFREQWEQYTSNSKIWNDYIKSNKNTIHGNYRNKQPS